jgi:hypothetical protein
MSKTVPATFVAPSIIKFATGEEINGEDFLACVQGEHTLWSRTGARMAGLILDPTYQTTAVTYVSGPTGGTGRNLSGWTGIIKPRRRVLSGGVYYWAVSFVIVGGNIDARATFYDDAEPGAGTAVTAVASVVGTTVATSIINALLPVTADLYLVYVEAKQNATGTGRLAQFGFYETADPSSYYP